MLSFSQVPLHRNLKIEDGLLSNESHFSLSDSKGYIWIATDAGINRYDGYKFKSFSIGNGLPESTVLKLYEDHQGRIWFSTLSSYVGYIQNDSVFNVKYKFRDESKEAKENFAYSLHVDNNDTLWVGTIYSGMLFKLAAPYTSAPIGIKMKKDFVIEFNKAGEYVYGTYCFPNQTGFEFYYKKKWNSKVLNYNFPSVSLSRHKRIAKTSDNKFYVDGDKEIYKLDNDTIRLFKQFNQPISFIHIDNQNTLWVGEHNNGLYKFPKIGVDNLYQHYFPKYTFTWISSDLEDGYWISSINKGILYIPDFSFNSIVRDIEINKIQPLPDNTIVVNEMFGKIHLIKYNNIFKTFDVEAINLMPYGSLYYYTIIDLNQKLNLESSKKSQLNFRNSKNQLLYLKYYSKNSINFFGANAYKVYILNKNDDVFDEAFTSPSRINDFLVDENNTIWVASVDGLISYDLNKHEMIEWGKKKSSLLSRIDKIEIDHQNNLWLGTKGKGVIRFNIKDTIAIFNTTNGLPSNFIREIHADKFNNIWIATNNGLCKIDGNTKSNMIDYSYLSSYNFGSINDLYRANDSLFISSSNGLYSFSIPNLDKKISNINLPIYVTNVLSGNLNFVKEISEIPFSENSIKFSFLAITFSNAKSFEYQYTIKGFENKWHSTKNTYIEYINLPSGNYTFMVKAVCKNSAITSKTAMFNFSIEKPFWEKLWFIGLLILLFTFIVYLFIRIRIRHITKKEQAKAAINIALAELEAKALRSQMNPHFIFNSLNSIQSYILQNNVKAAHLYLGKFSTLIREILENSKSDKISIQNEIKMLENYLELEKMRANDSFDFEIICENTIDEFKTYIPIMFIQPFVENAILHGVNPLKNKKGNINITFQYFDTTSISCTIEDNGIGRKASEELKNKKQKYHESMGLSVSSQRLTQYNQSHNSSLTIEILDLYDTKNISLGTKVKILIPVLKK